ncbi:hypothetical protein [Pseudomonas sp. 43(2021)]|uniref:hypothetical protein n=1 Tax=unclassified Pseudomonas TaxID=196821 RepID=UPI001A9E4229|nr:hypothetical protein [Pseudomonas sp. 43(2021)]
MPYIVINTSNNFDPIHQNEYASAQEADAAARKLLEEQPTAHVRTAQLLKRYSATVTVIAADAGEQPSDVA